MLLRYLIHSDARFYRLYAVPLIASCPEQFDLDGFRALISQDNGHGAYPDSLPFTNFEEAYQTFEQDTDTQYEMHPKFGRYVWDIADQWYQKWNVIFSLDHMWNWAPQDQAAGDVSLLHETASSRTFQATSLKPWLDHITQRHHIHPDHRRLLEHFYDYLVRLNQTNRPLALVGAGSLNTMPFFPPNWFVDKQVQKRSKEGLASSFLARFVPPYRLTHVPERWDVVFLKGLTVDSESQFAIDPVLLATSIPSYGLTLIYDDQIGYSLLAMVMKKATFGNLEDSLPREVPMTYEKPRALALSVTKRIKDLHWEYVHGNVHPRNILLNFADYVGELADITFMHRNTYEDCVQPRRRRRRPKAGRWPYVAPELVNGDADITTAADIYALGIILWQLISRVTFPDDALVDPHVYRIEPIPGVLKEWQDLCIDCLHPDPSKRPNAYTVYRRLENIPTNASLSEDTRKYIIQRRTEIQSFLETHRISTPSMTSAQVGEQIWTASVTRMVNQGLERFPCLVQSFSHCI